MARCGCGGSCSCAVIQGDRITVSGTGSTDDPYIITGDPIDYDDLPGILTVNGLSGPDVVLGADNVGALLPYAVSDTLTSGQFVAMQTISTFNNTPGGADIIAGLPALTDALVNGHRSAIIKKDDLDLSGKRVIVGCNGTDKFKTGASTFELTAPGEWVEVYAMKIGAVRYWKVLRTGLPRVSMDLTYAQAAQTPSLEEMDRTVNFTLTTVAQTEPLGGENFDARVGAMNVQFNTAVAASDTNYWTVNLNRYRGSEIIQVLSSKTTKVTGGQAITAFVPWTFDNINWPETLRYMRKGDGLSISFTPTGTPTTPGKAVVNIRYEPNVVPVIRDTFNRNNSTTTLGISDSGQQWLPHVGVWGILNQTAYPVSVGNDGVDSTRAFASIDGPPGNTGGYTVSAKYTGNPASISIGVRGSKSSGGLTSGYYHTAGAVFRIDASVLNTTAMVTLSQSFVTGDTITWNVTAGVHTLYRNGIQVGQFTDNTYLTSNRILLKSASAGVGATAIDDLVITV